jgi:putative transposase
VKGAVSKDHVHILTSYPRMMAPSEIMRWIKGRTSSKLFEEFPHLKKSYWENIFGREGTFVPRWGK